MNYTAFTASIQSTQRAVQVAREAELLRIRAERAVAAAPKPGSVVALLTFRRNAVRPALAR